MASKEEEAMQRAVLGRVADGIAELLRAADSIEKLLESIDKKLDLLVKMGGEQAPVVAQFAESMKVELAEVARIKAEKVAGKSALLALVTDARVMAVLVPLVVAFCTAALAYFGVLPHANN